MASLPRNVQAYVYDLPQGMARQFSPMLLGQQIDGVWHTGLVVDGREWFFGYGVQCCAAGTTPFGLPARVLDLGTTEVPPELVKELVEDLRPRYRPDDYNLLFHNCNHFTNEMALLLTGGGLPDDILGQAQLVLNTPMGQMLMPMIMQMEGLTGSATATGFNGPAAAPTSTTAAAAPSSAPPPGAGTAPPPAAAAAAAAAAIMHDRPPATSSTAAAAAGACTAPAAAAHEGHVTQQQERPQATTAAGMAPAGDAAKQHGSDARNPSLALTADASTAAQHPSTS